MNYNECVEMSKAGKPCQMMDTKGNWVEFDPAKVITKFRVAPQLGRTDGAKVLIYALNQLEKRVEKFFHDKGKWVDLPERGHKADPFLIYGYRGYLGNREYDAPIRTYEGETLGYDREVDTSCTRLRDVFRSYFRVEKWKIGDAYSREIVRGTTAYTVGMRDLRGEENWIELFNVYYARFVPGSQYDLVGTDNDEFETDWLVEDHCTFYLPETADGNSGSIYSARKRSKEGYGKKEYVSRQRIPTISKVNRAGGDVFHNIARYVISYLTVLSDMDMNMDNFSSFISRNLKERDIPTHRVYTPSWKDGGKSTVSFNLLREFREYRDAALGKRNYDKDGCADMVQTYAILLRYFNTKYNGTIDRVTE